MLPTAIVKEITALIQAGNLSNRKIAARLRVSRGVVNAIANGTRRPYGRDPSGDASQGSWLPRRCPNCGYRVYMPCVACYTRHHLQSKRLCKLLARTNQQHDQPQKQAG